MPRRIPHPLLVLLISCAGFLPIVALFAIAGRRAAAAHDNPQRTFALVHPATFKGRAWIATGNIGDAIGFYFVALPIAACLRRVAPTAWGRRGGTLLLAYTVNGAFWALLGAVLLPLAVDRTEKDWRKATTLCQSFGWGVIGNTLGGAAWLLLAWSYRRQRPGFAACNAALGSMYLLGGRIEHRVVPSKVSLVGVTFYLFVQLLIWNPWAAHVCRTATPLVPAAGAGVWRPSAGDKMTR